MLRRLIKQFNCCVLLIAVFALPAHAIEPEHKLGTWVGATSSLRYSDKWSLFLQGELRTWEFADNFNELLWRVAGLYDVNPKNMLAFGYVRVDTWPYTDEGLRKFYENRTYQEYLHKLPVGWGKLKNRFRLEQRWIATPEYGTEYSNRFRWKIGYTHQLKNREGGASKWYLTGFNEIFVDFDNNGYWFNLNGFDKGLNQNRLYFGGGRKTGPLAKLQIGLLWQHRPEADFVRFVLGYSHNFDFRGDD